MRSSALSSERLRHLLNVGSGLLLRSLLAALAGLMAARYLGPEIYGQSLYFLAWVGMIGALSEPGLRLVCGREVARCLERGALQKAGGLGQTYLGLRLILALPLASTAALYLSAAPPFEIPLITAKVDALVIFAVVIMVILGQHAQALAEMSSAFGKTGRLLALASIGRTAFILLLIFADGFSGTLLIFAEATYGFLMVAGLKVWGNPLPGSFMPRLKGGLGLLRSGGYFAVATLMGLVMNRADILLLKAFSTVEEVAFYGAAMGLALKADLIKNAMLTVWYPKLSTALGADLEGHLRSMGRMSLVGVLLFIPFMLVGAVALVWGAGLAYLGALLPFFILTLALAIQLVVEPAALVLYIHRPRQIAFTETVMLLLLVPLAMHGAAVAGAGGVAAAMLTCRGGVGALKWLLSWQAARNLARVGA